MYHYQNLGLPSTAWRSSFRMRLDPLALYLYDEDFPDLPSRKWKTFEIVIGMKNSVIGVEPDEGEL